jgi:hypothetical protein
MVGKKNPVKAFQHPPGLRDELRNWLIEREVEFQLATNAYRLAILHRWLEANLFGRFDGAFGQSIGKSANDSDVGNASVKSIRQRNQHRALNLVRARFFGVLGAFLIKDCWA